MSDTTLNLAIDISKNAILEIIKRREEELSACCEFNNFTETQYDEFNKKTDTYRECLAVLDKSEFISKDDYMRLAADFDNYKKRITREKSNVLNLVNIEIITDFLSIVDDMERLLKSSECSQGFKLIFDNMIKFLNAKGCKKIKTTIGDSFDVSKHEAIFTRKNKDNECFEDDTICEIFQTGYEFNGKIIRPAKVVTVNNS